MTCALGAVGLEPAPYGRIPSAWLVTACERRLAEGGIDPEIAGTVDGRVIVCGRAAGYLSERTEQLLRIARSAGTGWVACG